ncbi:hypothetical protein ACFXKC_46745 [Streptomyces sp. NPDC059340]|uniref:hypothetical protein n=1 Tax=Streptomyces sp. NPDC059340 TaxID=3346806 RepID=UPI00369010E9
MVTTACRVVAAATTATTISPPAGVQESPAFVDARPGWGTRRGATAAVSAVVRRPDSAARPSGSRTARAHDQGVSVHLDIGYEAVVRDQSGTEVACGHQRPLDVEGCFVGVHALGGGGADREVFFGFYPEVLAKGSTQTPSIFSLSLCTLIFGIAAA